MSQVLIQASLETRLQQFDAAFPTAWENRPFEPVEGQAFQRVFFIPNSPVDHGIAFDVKEWRGLFQISLMYPLLEGRGPAQQRAELLAAHFAPYQELVNGAMKTMVYASPDIGPGSADDTRWVVPVTVYWRASKTA